MATSSVGNEPFSRLLYSLHRDVCASTWRVCVVSVTCALIEDYNGDGDTRRGGLEGGRNRGEREKESHTELSGYIEGGGSTRRQE